MAHLRRTPQTDVLAACAAAELKEGPRMVLLVLFLFTDSTGAAWPTEEQVADLAGMSASTVRANLALLHRAGLVWTITPAPSERGKVAAQVTYTDEKGRAKRLPRGRRLRYVMPVTPAHVRERIANDPRSYGLGAARGVRASGDDCAPGAPGDGARIEEARQRYDAAVKTAAEAQIEARAMKRCITETEERTRQERRANKHAMQASSLRFAVTLISDARDVAQAIERLIETAKDMENGR